MPPPEALSTCFSTHQRSNQLHDGSDNSRVASKKAKNRINDGEPRHRRFPLSSPRNICAAFSIIFNPRMLGSPGGILGFTAGRTWRRGHGVRRRVEQYSLTVDRPSFGRCSAAASFLAFTHSIFWLVSHAGSPSELFVRKIFTSWDPANGRFRRRFRRRTFDS